ncbi:hypothetical protein WJX82_005307 [Trebouxia sp. C0006]
MSQTGSGTVAQPPDVDVDESIVIDDDESEPASGTKRKRAGRKPSDAWGQNKVMQRLLLLALIMGGVPFAFVANLQFQHFLHCLRPSFVPPGQTMLRGSLLDGLYGEVLVQHAAWLADEKLAKHLTLFIDGWSNARMESIYAICVMFPDRRAILLDALDLSSLTHSAENIAEIVVKIMNQYGPKKFTGIVTDNARR